MRGAFPVDLKKTSFAELPGFDRDDHAASWASFYRSCRAICDAAPELRAGLPPDPALIALSKRVVGLGPGLSSAEAALFYRENLAPFHIENPDRPRGGAAFLTAYYRPEIPASFVRTDKFSEPLFARPADLVTLQPGEQRPDLPGLAAARRRSDGSLEPYPTRAEIDRAPSAVPLAFVADAIEAFMIHVQGSARLSIDGRSYDLTYAGRNGHPYVSIGRVLVSEGEIDPAEMSLRKLKGWVRQNGQRDGERGRGLLHRNPSFIFFSLAPSDGASEPTGAAGYELTPYRSIAVDRSIWPYGLPYWIHADLPWQHASNTSNFSRMMVGQDTGSAIIGPSRADLFFGTGAHAGDLAGGIRHHGSMFVLLPVGEER